jgi:hypothetical protein
MLRWQADTSYPPRAVRNLAICGGVPGSEILNSEEIGSAFHRSATDMREASVVADHRAAAVIEGLDDETGTRVTDRTGGRAGDIELHELPG